MLNQVVPSPTLATTLKEAYKSTPLPDPLIALINSYISSFIFPTSLLPAAGIIPLYSPPSFVRDLPNRVTAYFRDPELGLHIMGDQEGNVFLFQEPNQWITLRPGDEISQVLFVSVLSDNATILVIDTASIELYDLNTLEWSSSLFISFGIGIIFLNETRDHLFLISQEGITVFHFLHGYTSVTSKLHHAIPITGSATEDTVAVIEKRGDVNILCYRWLENLTLISEYLLPVGNIQPISVLTRHAFFFWLDGNLLSHNPHFQGSAK